jgi:hypothetical protein
LCSRADAKCNIGVNGTDQHGHACKDGTYCCYCEDPRRHGREVPCEQTLGMEDLRDSFGGHFHECRPGYPSYYCYLSATFSKLNTTTTRSLWYSSLSSGYCALHPTAPTCTWRVVAVEKIVTRECHAKVFGSAVQSTRPSSACLDGCGSQATNTSSPCWTDCFYQAAMGPESATPGGKVGGMSLAALTDAWERPFLPEEQGGCPPLEESRPWFAAEAVEEE